MTLRTHKQQQAYERAARKQWWLDVLASGGTRKDMAERVGLTTNAFRTQLSRADKEFNLLTQPVPEAPPKPRLTSTERKVAARDKLPTKLQAQIARLMRNGYTRVGAMQEILRQTRSGT